MTLTVDLERCAIVAPGDTMIPFDIDPSRRHALLQGLDELDQTLLSLPDIVAFQEQDRNRRPWIWETVERPREAQKTILKPPRTSLVINPSS